jgi:hypothetical protein
VKLLEIEWIFSHFRQIQRRKINYFRDFWTFSWQPPREFLDHEEINFYKNQLFPTLNEENKIIQFELIK